MLKLRKIFVSFVLLMVLGGGASEATTWTGASSSDWSNYSNWSVSEPIGSDDVYLDGAGIDPIITAE